uniref:Uncharacterized protein n=1 Tax=Setaria viridis TaxID=4556 RepID=A0A4U6W9V9_SETVI|nr:hypothetical protein SEVIR_1G110825v2 [Setaria viridis]
MMRAHTVATPSLSSLSLSLLKPSTTTTHRSGAETASLPPPPQPSPPPPASSALPSICPRPAPSRS